MKIPKDAIIPDAKLTQYLLVHKAKNDKSKFLAQAGFTQGTSQTLRAAIRALIALYEATEDGIKQYGTFYRVIGMLKGPNGRSLPVVTVWVRREIDN